MLAVWGWGERLMTIFGCWWQNWIVSDQTKISTTVTYYSNMSPRPFVSNICHQHESSNDVYRIFSGHTFGKNFCNSLSGIIPNNSFHAIVKQVLKSVIFWIVTLLSLLLLFLWHSVTGDDIIMNVVTAYITVFIFVCFSSLASVNGVSSSSAVRSSVRFFFDVEMVTVRMSTVVFYSISYLISSSR